MLRFADYWTSAFSFVMFFLQKSKFLLHTYPINFEKSSVNSISSPAADVSAIKKSLRLEADGGSLCNSRFGIPSRLNNLTSFDL